MLRVFLSGFPHSDIHDSSRLFAADHGFSQLVTSFFGLRCLRHPPYALLCLTRNMFYCVLSVNVLLIVNVHPSSLFKRGLVEMRRFELLTPCLQGRCSPNWATPPCLVFLFLLLFVAFCFTPTGRLRYPNLRFGLRDIWPTCHSLRSWS